MKQQKNAMRYVKLFFFAFLFLSALSLSVYFALPIRMEHTAKAAADEIPLSLPCVRVLTNEMFSDEDRAELARHGDVVFYTRELLSTTLSVKETAETAADTADATLYTVGAEHAEAFYMLKEGRMPQNGSECVISSVRGAFYEIGDTLVLWSGETPLYRLTVVGLADDGDSMLSAFVNKTDATVIPTVHIYRPEDGSRAAEGDALCYIAAITGTEDANASADALKLYAKANYEAETDTAYVPDTDAMDAAQAAVNEAEIQRLRIVNQIASLDIAAREAEDAYLSASAALEYERQEFLSSMERHEAVRANQTQLITRKEAAEETFAKKEAELAVLYEEIEGVYAERDMLKFSLAEAQTAVAEAEAALQRLKDGDGEAGKSAATVTWSIATPRDGQFGDATYAGLISGGKLLSYNFLIAGIFCVGLMAVCILLLRGRCGADMDLGVENRSLHLFLLTLYTLLTAVCGVVIGGILLPRWKFDIAFFTFDGVLAQPKELFLILAVVAVALTVVFLALNGGAALLFERARASEPVLPAFSDDE